MYGKELDLLVQDCITHRLSDKESLEYIKTRLNHTVSLAALKRRKYRMQSEKSLNQYYNYHTRIGFVKDQRDRKNEVEAVLNDLMRKWKQYTITNNTEISQLTKLSSGIIEANRRLEEISLSTPIIAKIKMEVEIGRNKSISKESGEHNQSQIYNQRQF